jgi:hypothetical protein
MPSLLREITPRLFSYLNSDKVPLCFFTWGVKGIKGGMLWVFERNFNCTLLVEVGQVTKHYESVACEAGCDGCQF